MTGHTTYCTSQQLPAFPQLVEGRVEVSSWEWYFTRIMSHHPEPNSHYKSKTLIWNRVPICVIQRSENQGIEAEIASFTIFPSDPCGEFVLPISVILDSVVPQEGTPPPGPQPEFC